MSFIWNLIFFFPFLLSFSHYIINGPSVIWIQWSWSCFLNSRSNIRRSRNWSCSRFLNLNFIQSWLCLDLLLEHSQMVLNLLLIQILILHTHRYYVLDHLSCSFLDRVALILAHDTLINHLKLLPFLLLSKLSFW